MDTTFVSAPDAAAELNMPMALFLRLAGEERIPVEEHGGVTVMRRDVLDDMHVRAAQIRADLDKARRKRRTIGQQVAAELGLADGDARRLGFV